MLHADIRDIWMPRNERRRHGWKRAKVPGSRRQDETAAAADETPREADEEKIVEPSKDERTITRDGAKSSRKVAMRREGRGKEKDTRRIKPRLGLESDAVARKFM